VNILVTNDDGINSQGLEVLANALKELGDVFTVAPDRQRSAVGLSITIDRPLRIKKVGDSAFSVDGMPADCVTLAIHRLMDSSPDLIVSGINDGQNIGYDVYHSGTVGAALVGTMFSIPSLAVSIANRKFNPEQDVIWYDTAAQVALNLARIVHQRKLPDGISLNVNVPNVPPSEIEGIEITKHCSTTYEIEVHNRLDPRGRSYYWLGGEFRGGSDHSETDLEALRRNRVSVTPLRLDMTDYTMMQELANWILDLQISSI
jgi:5'-nucleotidase